MEILQEGQRVKWYLGARTGYGAYVGPDSIGGHIIEITTTTHGKGAWQREGHESLVPRSYVPRHRDRYLAVEKVEPHVLTKGRYAPKPINQPNSVYHRPEIVRNHSPRYLLEYENGKRYVETFASELSLRNRIREITDIDSVNKKKIYVYDVGSQHKVELETRVTIA